MCWSDPSFEVKISYLCLAFLPCFRWVESAPKWKLLATVDENLSDLRDKAHGLAFEGVGAQTVLTLFFVALGARWASLHFGSSIAIMHNDPNHRARDGTCHACLCECVSRNHRVKTDLASIQRSSRRYAEHQEGMA